MSETCQDLDFLGGIRVVDFTQFEAATARFGQRGTMTLTNLIACYAVLAYNMNTYELEASAHPTEKALP